MGSIPDRGMSLFIVQSNPNCSNIADLNLKRQGFQAFLPMEETLSQYKGRSVTTVRPLILGYTFVVFDFACVWRKVISTFGIARLVSFGRGPATVPLDLLSSIMLRFDPAGKVSPPQNAEILRLGRTEHRTICQLRSRGGEDSDRPRLSSLNLFVQDPSFCRSGTVAGKLRSSAATASSKSLNETRYVS
ncbi:transcription termination/antitermination NusG family protein [Alexandriicola marinus]|uniref:transcription termination/antitermination NusG family protein n=1 Tax=Alexandriicola marinus TaxID=2081710 RepID=UPI000FDB70F2